MKSAKIAELEKWDLNGQREQWVVTNGRGNVASRPSSPLTP